MEGSGRMIVIAVGANSQTGVIYTLMKSGKKGKSILQCKLADLAVKIGYFGMCVCVCEYGEKRIFFFFFLLKKQTSFERRNPDRQSERESYACILKINRNRYEKKTRM